MLFWKSKLRTYISTRPLTSLAALALLRSLVKGRIIWISFCRSRALPSVLYLEKFYLCSFFVQWSYSQQLRHSNTHCRNKGYRRSKQTFGPREKNRTRWQCYVPTVSLKITHDNDSVQKNVVITDHRCYWSIRMGNNSVCFAFEIPYTGPTMRRKRTK
jgi:hypothetical protein